MSELKFSNVGKCIAACKNLSRELSLSLPTPPRGMAFNVVYWNKVHADLENVKAECGDVATTAKAVASPQAAPVVAPAAVTPVDYSKLPLDQQIAARATGANPAPVAAEIATLQTLLETSQPGLTRDCLQAKIETLKAQLPKK